MIHRMHARHQIFSSHQQLVCLFKFESPHTLIFLFTRVLVLWFAIVSLLVLAVSAIFSQGQNVQEYVLAVCLPPPFDS